MPVCAWKLCLHVKQTCLVSKLKKTIFSHHYHIYYVDILSAFPSKYHIYYNPVCQVILLSLFFLFYLPQNLFCALSDLPAFFGVSLQHLWYTSSQHGCSIWCLMLKCVQCTKEKKRGGGRKRWFTASHPCSKKWEQGDCFHSGDILRRYLASSGMGKSNKVKIRFQSLKVTTLQCMNANKYKKCDTWKATLPSLSFATLFGLKLFWSSLCTNGSFNLRPRIRVKPLTVFLKLVTACCLAATPTTRFFSPNDTYDLPKNWMYRGSATDLLIM